MIAVLRPAGPALDSPDRSPHLIQNDVGQRETAPRTEGVDIFPNEWHLKTPFSRTMLPLSRRRPFANSFVIQDRPLSFI
jgi:hypothetical protein